VLPASAVRGGCAVQLRLRSLVIVGSEIEHSGDRRLEVSASPSGKKSVHTHMSWCRDAGTWTCTCVMISVSMLRSFKVPITDHAPLGAARAVLVTATAAADPRAARLGLQTRLSGITLRASHRKRYIGSVTAARWRQQEPMQAASCGRPRASPDPDDARGCASDRGRRAAVARHGPHDGSFAGGCACLKRVQGDGKKQRLLLPSTVSLAADKAASQYINQYDRSV
jgi:hypothetical protein